MDGVIRLAARSFKLASVAADSGLPASAVNPALTRDTVLLTSLTKSRTFILCSNCSRRFSTVTPVAVIRGSSINVNACVPVHEPAVSRTEYRPGTAAGPFGDSGRVGLAHAPGYRRSQVKRCMPAVLLSR